MTQPLLPSTIETQLRHVTFLTAKTVFRKDQENDGQTGSPCLDKPVLAQAGGSPRRWKWPDGGTSKR